MESKWNGEVRWNLRKPERYEKREIGTSKWTRKRAVIYSTPPSSCIVTCFAAPATIINDLAPLISYLLLIRLGQQPYDGLHFQSIPLVYNIFFFLFSVLHYYAPPLVQNGHARGYKFFLVHTAAFELFRRRTRWNLFVQFRHWKEKKPFSSSFACLFITIVLFFFLILVEMEFIGAQRKRRK